MKKTFITLLLLSAISYQLSAQKDTTVTDTAYVKMVIEDIKKADDAVYGKVNKEQYQLIQQYNQLIVQIAMQRKKRVPKK